MASNSFKIKNSLVLTPKDLSTLVSPEAGDLACDINDNNKIKRYDANAAAWVEVGSGGVGGVDILFVQDFESASLSSFTQVGLVLSQTDPLKGKVSAELTHDSSVDQSIKQIIPVDRKFRGVPMVLRLDSKSSASQGNLVINIKDETNNVDIVASEQLQLSNEVSGKKTSVGFTIPETCASISYTITALPEAGSPVTRIDDIIAELAVTSLLETVVELTGDAQTLTIPLTQSGLVQDADSMIRLDTYLGYGSVATKIPRFTNIRENIGSEILYQDSATNGSSFTAQKDGVYSFTFDAGSPNSADYIGLSLNSTQLTTNIDTITAPNRLAISGTDSSGFAAQLVQWTGILRAGDVVRPHTRGGVPVGANFHNFTATYQGSLKQVSVSSDQKITIPTSELRFEGASTRGSTATAIVKFDTMAKLRGDAFTVESDSVLGTRITMKKAGKLSVTTSVMLGAAGNLIAISKNQTNLASSLATTEWMSASNYIYTNSSSAGVSWDGSVQIGDIIRVVATSAPTANALNSLDITLQEQEIAVSVTNTLPQFSESDSSVRVDTANGYGSTGTKIRRFSNVRDNIGADVEYVDSATNGASFTVKSAGVYNVSYSDNFNASSFLGISKNASSLSTEIGTLAAAERLVLGRTTTTNTADTVSWQGYLLAGDIIRPQTSGDPTGVIPAYSSFTISKVGKPNVTGVDVTPFVNVPQPEVQSVRRDASSSVVTGAASNFTGTPNITNGNGIFSYNTLGEYTFLKAASVNASFGLAPASAGRVQTAIMVNGVAVGRETSESASGAYASTSANIQVNAGDVLTFQNTGAVASSTTIMSMVATALSDSIITANESFSTDTASLSYASSAAYTLSTLQNAPVGTYITFTYAASTNTRTQTTTRPTQTDADMNVNGMLIYTRAYNAASTAANPAAIAIQIGKGLKGKSLDLYKSVGKVTAGSLDYWGAVSTVFSYGAALKNYNEMTGVLLVDSGNTITSTVTGSSFLFIDNTSQSSGYLVINASKSPALTGVPLVQPRIATLKDVKASGTAGGTSVATTWSTRVLNTLSDPTGITNSLTSNQFTLLPGEYYIEAESPISFGGGGLHKARIRNITDSTTVLVGSSQVQGGAAGSGTRSKATGTVVISSTKVFELQYYASAALATNGLGYATSSGESEVYSTVKITKVK